MAQFKNKLQPGQIESNHTEKMLSIKWINRQEVHMLTTMHKNEQSAIHKHGKIMMKPKCIKEYNENFG